MILAIMTEAYGCSGGIQQFNRDWSEAMAKAGHMVSLVVRRGKPANMPAQVRQIAKPGKIGFIFVAISRLIRERPRQLFCGHANYGFLCAVLGRLFSVPVWMHLHGIEAWDRQSRLWRWTLRQCALVTCASRYTRKMALRSSTEPTSCVYFPTRFRITFRQDLPALS